ncbi:hypothetical protein [Vagococcus bubulae]|uniref:Uncharacterized protein n=1 Tax=Vagococcus bubulae TaxID=1977868 RepID=A0A429ZC34_9ENTE|nr:hypothetical protein [Vagococcus bubulae]RST91205.1 hypothetical protein CBF36_10300 [Vagococcus bubulae]
MENKFIYLMLILFSLLSFGLDSSAELEDSRLNIIIHLYDPSDDSILDQAGLDKKEFDIYDITELVQQSERDFIELQKEFLNADEGYMRKITKDVKRLSYDKTELKKGIIQYNVNLVGKDIQYMMILENKDYKQSMMLKTSPMLIKVSDSIFESTKNKLELYPKLYQELSNDEETKILYKKKDQYLLPQTGEVKNMMFYIGLLAVGSILYIKKLIGRNINEK